MLLTATTTILGLLPLTTGVEFDFHSFAISTDSQSSDYWGNMGVAVIFGLAFATFLTLILVPVLYDLLLAWRERRGTLGGGSGDGEVSGDEERAGFERFEDEPTRPGVDPDTRPGVKPDEDDRDVAAAAVMT